MGEVDGLMLRELREVDCLGISSSFNVQGWVKPDSLYLGYLEEQRQGIRDFILAEVHGNFAGYLTILWKPHYEYFASSGIPEIVDFNVLKKFQRMGIGTCLMNEAERRIKGVSDYAGIGFGLYRDYGPAQILYVRRGYIPNGQGLVKDSKSIEAGTEVTVDDGLILYLIKHLL